MDAEQELGTFINVAPAEKGKGKSVSNFWLFGMLPIVWI